MSVQILKQNGYRFLWIDKYLWMWDIPVERSLQKNIANEAYGEVLVAGYGLGLVQKYLLENKKVLSVTTIEKNKDVVKACYKEYDEIYGYVWFKDFYDYNTDCKFDCVIGDIWEDIIPESLDAYKKFKLKAKTLLEPNGKILAWGKDYFEYLIEQDWKVVNK